MNRFYLVILLLSCGLILSGCLKTNIVTNQSPSNQEAELAWAHGFVYGLVPPVNAPLNTEAVCGEAGVSEVEFQQTFVQGIAQGATFSLYSPQQFTATCASGATSSASSPSMNLTDELKTEASSPSDNASFEQSTEEK